MDKNSILYSYVIEDNKTKELKTLYSYKSQDDIIYELLNNNSMYTLKSTTVYPQIKRRRILDVF